MFRKQNKCVFNMLNMGARPVRILNASETLLEQFVMCFMLRQGITLYTYCSTVEKHVVELNPDWVISSTITIMLSSSFLVNTHLSNKNAICLKLFRVKGHNMLQYFPKKTKKRLIN